MREISELENNSEIIRELDEKFDIREFHNQILNSGSLPLVLLEKKIEDWIKTQM